jgi:RepB DNA-primase from phage plasmid
MSSAIDHVAPLRFLRVAYEESDWVAVFLKSYDTGQVAQRIEPRTIIASRRFQAWLRWRNLLHWNIYIGLNAVSPHRRSRTRESIAAIRHVFVEADHDGRQVLRAIAVRPDLPSPSYVLHSSPDRVHVFWRAAGFDVAAVERLQKHLAHQLRTDIAATPATQTTRLPGFYNHKRTPPHLVTIDYLDLRHRHRPSAFPRPTVTTRPWPTEAIGIRSGDALGRARRYLGAVPPAVSGQHGDLHTFKVCCRLTRGFALSDSDALSVLAEWNVRCEPPWSEQELLDKIRRARRHGCEPVGGLLSSAARAPISKRG